MPHDGFEPTRNARRAKELQRALLPSGWRAKIKIVIKLGTIIYQRSTRYINDMWEKRNWRHRSTSKRRKLVTALAGGQDSFRMQSTSRARQLYLFFADFWRATPHPIAQVCIYNNLLCVATTLFLRLAASWWGSVPCLRVGNACDTYVSMYVRM